MIADCRQDKMVGRHLISYLDGVKLEGCVAANEEKGEAVVLKLNEQGQPYLEEKEGGKAVATELLKGEVKLYIRAGSLPPGPPERQATIDQIRTHFKNPELEIEPTDQETMGG